MNVRDEIKSIIVRTGWSMSDVVNALNEKYGRNDSLQNLSNKLRRGTLKYKEAEEIADILGYKIEWVEREK